MHRSNHGPGGSLSSYLAHGKKTGADKTGSITQASKTRTHSSNNSRNRGPEARAQLHGPRRSARRSSRPKTRRAAHRRMCTAQLTPLKSRRGALTSAAQLWRVSAPYWPKIARRKTKNFFYWIKITFRFANGNFLMRTAVFLYNIVCVYRFSMCISLDVHGEACLPY